MLPARRGSIAQCGKAEFRRIVPIRSAGPCEDCVAFARAKRGVAVVEHHVDAKLRVEAEGQLRPRDGGLNHVAIGRVARRDLRGGRLDAASHVGERRLAGEVARAEQIRPHLLVHQSWIRRRQHQPARVGLVDRIRLRVPVSRDVVSDHEGGV